MLESRAYQCLTNQVIIEWISIFKFLLLRLQEIAEPAIYQQVLIHKKVETLYRFRNTTVWQLMFSEILLHKNSRKHSPLRNDFV